MIVTVADPLSSSLLAGLAGKETERLPESEPLSHLPLVVSIPGERNTNE